MFFVSHLVLNLLKLFLKLAFFKKKNKKIKNGYQNWKQYPRMNIINDVNVTLSP